MEHARTPEQALDLLLALRPDDQDHDDALLALIDPADRAAIEREDAAFAAMLRGWSDDLGEPSFTGADIIALADSAGGEAPESFPLPSSTPVEAERPDSDAAAAGRAATGSRSSWFAPVAVAAGLAISVVGLWAIQAVPDAELGSRPKALVGEQAASRIGLQVTVERDVGGRAILTPARQGAAYGVDEALAFQLALDGASGWVTLLEVDPAGSWTVIYPGEGRMHLQPGTHAVAAVDGAPVVYRPDVAAAGTLTYVALVTSEDVEPALVVPGLLSAGFDRADLWPRPVVAVDSFTVTWESR